LIVCEQIESLQIEMDRIKEENNNLKMDLSRGMKNYRNLQMHLFSFMQQQQEHNPQLKMEVSFNKYRGQPIINNLESHT